MKRKNQKGASAKGQPRWTCETCGDSIAKPSDGFVEWVACKAGTTQKMRYLRLVHHLTASPLRNRRSYGCYDGHSPEGRDLPSFLGADGLMYLLSLFEEKAVPPVAIADMIKRLHIPGYESARPHFTEAISEGIIEPNLPEGYYWQSEIQTTLNWAEQAKTRGD